MPAGTPAGPRGVTDQSHSRQRPAPVDSCLDESLRQMAGNQALDFSEIEKTQELEMDSVEKSKRKSRSPSLDSFLRFFWALGPVKDTIF